MRYGISLKSVRTKKQFHEKIKKAIPCPEYYGENMDALYDVLTEHKEEWELVFQEYETFSQRMPRYASVLKQMCEDAVAECPNLSISFE